MPKLNTSEILRELASAVAKTVTSLLFGNGPVATILSTVTGALAKGLEPAVRANKLTKAVEEFAAKVTDGIVAAYRRDPKPGRLGTAESAMHDFHMTLQAADLSMGHLITIKLDPDKLAQKLLECQPAYLDRYTHRGQIVSRACNEFAKGIMDMVPTLAEFQLSVTRELLERQENMVLAIEKLLQDRRVEPATATDGKDAAAEWRR